jgi:hypothetical protein
VSAARLRNQHVIASGNAPKLDVSGAMEGISLMSALGQKRMQCLLSSSSALVG